MSRQFSMVTEMLLYTAVKNVVDNSACVCDGDIEADCLHCECAADLLVVDDLIASRESRRMEVLRELAEIDPFPGL